MLLFGSIGAITWAVRGTSGWGGIDGTIVPGISWGVLWWYVCWRNGIDARSVPLWLGLGIALGGELGYGQYVSWIRGMFNLRDEIVSIAPWIGYVWFAICGIGWGAPGGIILGWTLAGRRSAAVWLMRLVLPVGVALLARVIVQAVPWLFFPNWHLDAYVTEPDSQTDPAASAVTQWQMTAVWCVCLALSVFVWRVLRRADVSRLVRGLVLCAAVTVFVLLLPVAEWLFFPGDQLGLFSGALDKHAGRTVYTNSQNAIVAGWWLGALLVAMIQRDRATLRSGLIIGGGFGVLFALAAVWCLGYEYAPKLADWWKMWELQSGFFLGPLYVIVLFRAMKETGRTEDQNDAEPSQSARWSETTALAAAGMLILWLTGRDEFAVVSLLLGLLLIVGLLAATRDPLAVENRRRAVQFVYSVFLLLFIMAWGMSAQLGIVLGLYDAGDVDQYAWPLSRVLIFALPGFVITGVAVAAIGHACRTDAKLPSLAHAPLVSARLVDLMTFTGVVGAVSIWPAKIGALYAVFLMTALYAFHRLNHRFDETDATRSADGASRGS